jgi:DNA processing protein
MLQYGKKPENNKRDAKGDKLALLNADEVQVYEALGPYPIHIDDLARKISVGPGKLSSILLKLELSGLAQQSPGKFFTIAS